MPIFLSNIHYCHLCTMVALTAGISGHALTAGQPPAIQPGGGVSISMVFMYPARQRSVIPSRQLKNEPLWTEWTKWTELHLDLTTSPVRAETGFTPVFDILPRTRWSTRCCCSISTSLLQSATQAQLVPRLLHPRTRYGCPQRTPPVRACRRSLAS